MRSQATELEWPANRVRDTFIKFFENKGHVHWTSNPLFLTMIILSSLIMPPNDRLRELTEVAVAGVIRDIEGDSVGREPYSGEDMKASRCGEPSYDSVRGLTTRS
ncbi:Alanine--tRNA ligase [Forsythia ovata]|uniref:Alanine--tRNA ligase n=1 Tax=Forsythia ovata TaxID=205694 RepID=A0ABD1RIA8_9LAMI